MRRLRRSRGRNGSIGRHWRSRRFSSRSRHWRLRGDRCFRRRHLAKHQIDDLPRTRLEDSDCRRRRRFIIQEEFHGSANKLLVFRKYHQVYELSIIENCCRRALVIAYPRHQDHFRSHGLPRYHNRAGIGRRQDRHGSRRQRRDRYLIEGQVKIELVHARGMPYALIRFRAL